jgi:hypothetical protein
MRRLLFAIHLNDVTANDTVATFDNDPNEKFGTFCVLARPYVDVNNLPTGE